MSNIRGHLRSWATHRRRRGRGRVDRVFRRAVRERLRALDGIAEHTGLDLPVPMARTQIRRITKGWRELLSEHEPDAMGRCPVCSGWWWRRKWPCQVWAIAYYQLINDTPEEPQSSPEAPRLRSSRGSSFPRLRGVEIIDRRMGAIAGRPRVDFPTRVNFRSRRPVTPSKPKTVQIHRAVVVEQYPTAIEQYPTVPRPRLAPSPRG